jgi:hypothetical protein
MMNGGAGRGIRRGLCLKGAKCGEEGSFLKLGAFQLDISTSSRITCVPWR